MAQLESGMSAEQCRREAGVSLLELLLVLAMIALLSVLATLGYRQHVLRARRVQVQACLQQHALQMERYYGDYLSYDDPQQPLPVLACDDDSERYYQLQRQVLTATEFNLQAEPLQGQREDHCGTLQLASTGEHSAEAEECW